MDQEGKLDLLEKVAEMIPLKLVIKQTRWLKRRKLCSLNCLKPSDIRPRPKLRHKQILANKRFRMYGNSGKLQLLHLPLFIRMQI
jgi:hypothetical protein